MCSGMSLLARMPPWILGCSVFTRPPRISGKPVTSLTAVTGRPAACRAFMVPPVETSSTPFCDRKVANSTSPVLSVTLRMARRIGSISIRILLGSCWHYCRRRFCQKNGPFAMPRLRPAPPAAMLAAEVLCPSDSYPGTSTACVPCPPNPNGAGSPRTPAMSSACKRPRPCPSSSSPKWPTPKAGRPTGLPVW